MLKKVINLIFATFIILITVTTMSSRCDMAKYEYHNYVQLTKLLKNFAAKYPTKTHLYSIGKSVKGRNLWVMAIADSHPDKHEILRPEAKYIGEKVKSFFSQK